MKAYIANDCSGKGHFGCTLVMETYREQFERVGIEEVTEPEKADLVVVNGEGSLHHGLRTDLLDWPARYPSVFVNGVYDSNPFDDGMNDFLYIAVRESMSAQASQEHGITADVVPDIVLTNDWVNDAVWDPWKYGEPLVTDNTKDPHAGYSAIRHPVEYTRKMTMSRQVVCGRFHAAICCMVMGIPFTTWDSNTHKIRGLMRDAGVAHLHAETQEAAIAMLDLEKTEIEASIRTYVEDGKKRINEMFEFFAGGNLV